MHILIGKFQFRCYNSIGKINRIQLTKDITEFLCGHFNSAINTVKVLPFTNFNIEIKLIYLTYI